MNRYSGRTGWMWMGWFGICAYLGGPMRASVGCMVFVSLGTCQHRGMSALSGRGVVPASCVVQWPVDVFGE